MWERERRGWGGRGAPGGSPLDSARWANTGWLCDSSCLVLLFQKVHVTGPGTDAGGSGGSSASAYQGMAVSVCIPGPCPVDSMFFFNRSRSIRLSGPHSFSSSSVETSLISSNSFFHLLALWGGGRHAPKARASSSYEEVSV